MIAIDSIRFSNFKSLVDVVVEFPPSGLVGIVGPNGCGKSNVVDGLDFVLGARSPVGLRLEGEGGVRQVIFAGSAGRTLQPTDGGPEIELAARPASDAAEVELVLANDDGALAGLPGRVSVARRIERDGSSSYTLMGKKVRAATVARLGLRRRIVIVKDGQVKQMLTAGESALRAMLEEALNIADARANLRAAESRLRQSQERFATLEVEVRSLERQLRSVAQRAARAERHSALKAEYEGLAGRLARIRRHILGRQIADLDRDIESLAGRIRKEQAELAEKETQHQLDGDALDLLLDRAVGVPPEAIVRELEEAIARLDAGDAAGAREILERLRADVAATGDPPTSAEGDKAGASDPVETGKKLRTRIKRLHNQIGRGKDELARLQLEHEALDRRRAALAAEQSELPAPGPDEERIDVTEREGLIRRAEALAAEIDGFGAVDESAAAEKHAVESQLQTKRDTYRGYETARRVLERWIAMLRERCREVLAEEIPRIGERFDRLFRRLFGPGAEAGLRIGPTATAEDPEEIWTHELVRDVRIPGKARLPMESMSGGERVLAGTAFVLACWWTAPPPVLLLDEADAHLDATNAPRAARLLSELAAGGQVIAITHNRETMGCGRKLVGVTMAQPGVSSVIDVVFEPAGSTEAPA